MTTEETLSDVRDSKWCGKQMALSPAIVPSSTSSEWLCLAITVLTVGSKVTHTQLSPWPRQREYRDVHFQCWVRNSFPCATFAIFLWKKKTLPGFWFWVQICWSSIWTLDCPHHFCFPAFLPWDSILSYTCSLFLLYSPPPSLKGFCLTCSVLISQWLIYLLLIRSPNCTKQHRLAPEI